MSYNTITDTTSTSTSINKNLKALNLIIKKDKATTGYKIVSSSSSCSLAKLRKEHNGSVSSSLSSSTSPIPSPMSTMNESNDDVISTTSAIPSASIEMMAFSSTLPSTSSSCTASSSSSCIPSSTKSFTENIFDNEPKIENDEKPLCDGNEEVEEKMIICDFCKKSGKSSEFHGRFCSKICIGRFAQRLRVQLQHEKKKSSQSLLNESNNIGFESDDKKIKDVKNNLENNELKENKLVIKLRNPISKQATLSAKTTTTTSNVNLLKYKKRKRENKIRNQSNKKIKLNDENNENQNNFSNCQLVLKNKNYVNTNDSSIVNSSKFNSYETDNSISNRNKVPLSDEILNKISVKEVKSQTTSNTDNLTEKSDEFNWQVYLKETNSIAAPEESFKNAFPLNKNKFQVGMVLEGIDIKHPELICVLSVSQVQGHRIRLHIDGYDSCYDFWRNADSSDIFPVGYCRKRDLTLMPPLGYESDNFDWNLYLSDKKAASESCFIRNSDHNLKPRSEFEIGMKLEAVDRHNPSLIRVATVVDKNKNEIKIHYDNWSDKYDVWFDRNSQDIHPINWCEKTGHPLTKPPSINETKKTGGCPTFGCTGLGHIKGPRFETHYSESGCPYSLRRLNKEIIPDRLSEQKQIESSYPTKKSHETSSLKGFNSKMTNNKRNNNKTNIILRQRTPKQMKYETRSKQLNEKNKNNSINHKDKENLNSGVAQIKLTQDKTRMLLKSVRTTLEEDVHETVFLSSTKPIYKFPFYVKYNKKLLIGIDKHSSNEVKQWSSNDVSNFIQTLPGCETSSEKFINQQIDGKAFLLMEQKNLIEDLKIKLGPAIKIYNSILAFREL